MFRASLCPSSGEQQQNCLKPHVVMPATQGEKNVGYIVVADFLSCDHVRVCACMWVQPVVIVGIVTYYIFARRKIVLFGIAVWYLESQREILWYRDVTTIRSSFNCRSRTGRLNWLHYVIKEGFYDRGDEKVFGLHDAIIHKISVGL
jgi:hypothetical protein